MLIFLSFEKYTFGNVIRHFYPNLNKKLRILITTKLQIQNYYYYCLCLC